MPFCDIIAAASAHRGRNGFNTDTPCAAQAAQKKLEARPLISVEGQADADRRAVRRGHLGAARAWPQTNSARGTLPRYERQTRAPAALSSNFWGLRDVTWAAELLAKRWFAGNHRRVPLRLSLTI